ncbi:MAG: hypothetical protein DRR06_13455 [Gammaproteobacteria bacterium]|nr:MAG: hypothetical protein DRR06_13455 [Gammaproteobacteria bacterium]
MRSPAGITIRNDAHGEGRFGASRKTRTHIGVDLDTLPKSYVYAPIDCTVKRIGTCYVGDPRFKLIELHGKCQIHRILYVNPNVIAGAHLSEGDVIGRSLDLRDKYGPAMVPHIHWEIIVMGIENRHIPASSNYISSVYVNPLELLGVI